jgi:hypothetical protein
MILFFIELDFNKSIKKIKLMIFVEEVDYIDINYI